jgi:uncharacterized damage-inducible protein DinB
MNEGLLELIRHKTWATLRLIEHCGGLSNEDLDATIPGTYGTIRRTLWHIVNSEEGYLSTMTRPAFHTKEEGAAFVRPDALPDGPVPLDELAARIRRMGPRWEALAKDADVQAGQVTTTDGWAWPASVVMAQAIHHAGDHRTHVMSILGARGLEIPGPNDLDVWGHAEATDLVQKL